MKKNYTYLIFVLFLLMSASGTGIAQTPMFYKAQANTASTSPFKNNGAAKCQLWYNPSDFDIPPASGYITAIFFRSYVAGQSGTYTNFKVLMKQPASGSQFGSGVTFAQGMTQVHSDPLLVQAGGFSVGGWYVINLTTPFPYDNTLPLIIETQYDAPFGGTGLENYSSTTGGMNKKIYASSTAATTGTANNTNWQDFGMDVVPALACAGMPNGGTAVTSAAAVCSGAVALLSLSGHSQGNGITYQWESAATMAGTYTPISSPSVSPYLYFYPVSTMYYRCAVTCAGNTAYSSPVLILNNALPGGSYTINAAQPTAGTNFQSFTAAAAAMNCGILGPVILDVAPGSGPYNEQFILPHINGTSPVNTIVVNGNGNTIGYSSANSSERAVIKLNGTDHVTISNLNVDATGGIYGFGIQLLNDANNNTITNCTVNCNTSSNSTTAFAGILINSFASSIIFTGASLCDSNTITGNTITGGYAGIALTANGTISTISNNQVINNTIKDFYLNGIYLNGGSNTIISGNNISRPTRTVSGNFQGIHLSGNSSNTEISRNILHNPFDGAPVVTSNFYPIYLNACTASSGNENVISNNLIYNDIGSSGNHYGMFNNMSSHVKYIHNTIALDDPSATCNTCATRGFHIQGTATNLTFLNNMVTINRGGTGYMHGIFFEPSSLSGYVMNGNNYYINPASNGSYKEIARTGGNSFVPGQGTGYTTIGSWQAACIQEANSKSEDPLYVDPATGNFMPSAGVIDNIGVPVSGISTDILAAARNGSNPDPGAYEFTGTVLSAGLLSFDATLAGNDVRLAWQVSDEADVTVYEAERSGDGRSFTGAGVKPVTAAMTGIKKYELWDRNPFALHKELYYRLKIISRDGSHRYSGIVKVKRDQSDREQIHVYPNPFREQLVVETDLSEESEGHIVLTDVLGHIVLEQAVSFSAGHNTTTLELNHQLPAGIYTISVETNGHKIIKKLTK